MFQLYRGVIIDGGGHWATDLPQSLYQVQHIFSNRIRYFSADYKGRCK